MDFKPTITVRGKLLKDPEMRFTEKGEPITNLSLALYTGGSKAKGYNPSLFVRISCWGELAEIANGLSKMQVITVEGTPSPKKFYKNQKGETVQADLEIKASKVEIEERELEDAHPNVDF